MWDVLVAKVKLNGSRVLPGVRQIKAGGVAQHMGMNRNSISAALAASATT
jgi:hypothetical protein